MYKSKYNLFTGTANFEKGKIYTAEQVEGVDLDNFEVEGEVAEAKNVVAPEVSIQAGENDGGEVLE
jgi:hypothetical protein